MTVERKTPQSEVAPEPSDASVLSGSALRGIVGDLFTPSPYRYWLDLGASAVIGWGSFYVCTILPAGSLAYFMTLALCVLALFRAVCFTHELVHLRKEAIPGLRTGWRIACGVPLLVPHFLYRGIHIAHHAKRDYGTSRDGEYFPFASRSASAIALHLAWNLIVPLTAIIRFTVLAYLTLISKKLRETIMRKASSMTLRMTFTRELPVRNEDLSEWRLEETLCTIYASAVIVAAVSGWIPLEVVIQWYVVIAAIAFLNAIRAIGATHRYISNEQESDFQGQVTDSVNVESTSILTLAMCPVGLRFHALHHMFPTMPYHNLEEAHRRLRQQLPTSNPYHECSIEGVFRGLGGVWRQASHS